MMKNLDAIKCSQQTGDESFHMDEQPLPFNLLNFWKWSSSDLLSNALRGVLAEFIVASELGCSKDTRLEWNMYDIKTPEGIKIEVKSAAYLQSWKQKKLSDIIFNIAPTKGWDATTNISTERKCRHADVYVFCLLDHMVQATVDPLNMDQWRFYILPTAMLDKKVADQKTIRLNPLLKLEPLEAKYGEIGKAINKVLPAELQQHSL